ncbi:MAG TPA: heme biosynthesis HemY N-terminal domain-containing protein [Agitococcus sp.]|nr:heme biosynthesis HemY N-terminal domain-containing protein [Agitococcus sp.]
MIKLAILLLFLLLGAWLGSVFLQDSGYVLIVWQQTSIELSLFLAVLLLMLAAGLGLIALELLLGVFGLRALLNKWLQQRRFLRAQRSYHKGLEALTLEDYRRAEKLFNQSAKISDEPLAAYLAAAQAAQCQQASQRAEDYLQLADSYQYRLIIQITRIRLWLQTGQWEAAVAQLKSIYPHYKKEPIVNQLLLESLVKLQAWQDCLEWLPILAKAPIAETITNQALMKTAYQHSLEVLAKTTGRVDKTITFRQLQEFWQQIPRQHQRDTDVVMSYVQALISVGFYDEASVIIARVLNENWHHGLAELYGRVLHAEPELALEQAKTWLKLHPQSPVLLLTLGRLSMQCRDWPMAKAYFEQSLVLHKNTETYAEFVRLLQHLNDPEAGHYLIAGLNQLISKPLPNLPLP